MSSRYVRGLETGRETFNLIVDSVVTQAAIAGSPEDGVSGVRAKPTSGGA